MGSKYKCKFYLRSPKYSWTDRHLNLHGLLRVGHLLLCKILSRYDFPLPPPNMRKCASSDSASIFASSVSHTAETPTPIFTVKWHFAQGCAFWVSKNYISTPYFISFMRTGNEGKSGSTVIDDKFAKLLCQTEPTLPSAMTVQLLEERILLTPTTNV